LLVVDQPQATFSLGALSRLMDLVRQSSSAGATTCPPGCFFRSRRTPRSSGG
jgi:hypothetical protein